MPRMLISRVVVGPRDGDADVGLGGEVEADLRPHLGEELALRAPDVALDEAGALGHVLALAVREIVEDDDLVTARDEGVRDVRTDESRSPRDDRPHPRILGAMFVTFEGLDGSGKTTQAELLRKHLEEVGRDVVGTREPGGTEFGERVRELLLDDVEITPWAEAALFAAARAELVERVIRPALERGADVVSDRYIDSSLAYQGIARGLGVDRVLTLNIDAIGGILPDVTFLILVSPEVAGERAGSASDRIEREGMEFLTAVDQAYRELGAIFPGRMLMVDGERPAEEIAEEVRDRLPGLP